MARDYRPIDLNRSIDQIMDDMNNDFEGHPSANNPAILKNPKLPFTFPTPVENTFILEDKRWQLIYNTKEVFLKDKAGMKFIAFLLKFPNEPFDAETIAHLGKVNPDGDSTPYSDMTNEALEEEGLAHSNEIREYILEPKVMKELKEKLEDLQARAAEADKNGNEELANTYRAQAEKTQKWLNKSKTNTGKPRTFSTTSDKIHNSITRAIRRALEEIETTHPELWQHLDQCIETSKPIRYRIENPPHWNISF